MKHTAWKIGQYKRYFGGIARRDFFAIYARFAHHLSANEFAMQQAASVQYNPFTIANWFICHLDRGAGDSITNLKLQKLLYYAQAWCMVLKEAPLFEDDFQAWAHGPVLPEIYHHYKEHGYNALPACDCAEEIDPEAEEVLLEVKRVYGERSGKYLEELTHQEDPWIKARKGLSPEKRSEQIITKESMVKYYSSILRENEREE